jgi:hypothetical protein
MWESVVEYVGECGGVCGRVWWSMWESVVDYVGEYGTAYLRL